MILQVRIAVHLHTLVPNDAGIQYWNPHIAPWQYALMIILPIFAMQLIHVRVYGAWFVAHETYSC